MTGMKKKVMKRIPVLPTNSPTVLQLPQRIVWPEGSEPHVTKRVPMMKMKNTSSPSLAGPGLLRRLLRGLLRGRLRLGAGRLLRAPDLVEGRQSGEARGVAQVFLDAEELVVLGDAVGT